MTDIGSDTARLLSAEQRFEWLDAAARWETRANLLDWAARRPRERQARMTELLRVEGLRDGHEADQIAWLLDQLGAMR